MIAADFPFQRVSFDKTNIRWPETYESNDKVPQSSLNSTDQQIFYQEHARLTQYTPPLSPTLHSSRTTATMRPYATHLMPGSSPYHTFQSHRGHQRTMSTGRTSTVASPNDSQPGTPRLSDQRSGSRPSSEFASSPNGGPFTPRSPHDVDFPTGHQMALSDPQLEEPYQTNTGFPEHYGGGIGGQSTGDCAIMTPGDRNASNDFSGPPYPDPDNIGDGQPTISPCVLQPAFDTNPYGNQQFQYPFPPISGPQYDPHSYGSEMGSLAATPVDRVGNGLDSVTSWQDSASVDEDSSLDTQRARTAASDSNAQQEHSVSSSPSAGSPVSTKGSGRRQLALRVPPQRSAFPCDRCQLTFETDTRRKKHTRKMHELPYLCVFHAYGCKEVFGTKNEWVRHVRVQHLRLETWRCELEQCNERGSHDNILPKGAKQTNDYGRKDLFLEHVRRIHKGAYNSRPEGEERKEFLNSLQQMSRIDLRRPPSSVGCPCCSSHWTDFDGWLEHVAKGMETKKGIWDDLRVLENWMINEGLLEWQQARNRWRLEGAEGKRGGRQSRQRKQDARNGVDSDDEEDDEPKPSPRRTQRQRKQVVRTRRRSAASNAPRANGFTPLVPSQRL